MPHEAEALFTPPTSDPRPEPKTAYERLFHDALDVLFAAFPVWATDIGFHAHDDRWPDLTPSGRERRLGALRELLGRVDALDDAELSRDERIDKRILRDALEATIFDDEDLREGAWDPASYVSLAGNGLFALLAREFAPFSQRGAAFLARVLHVEEVFEAARQNLGSAPDRPVSLLHTETALGQLPGVGELLEEAIAEAERQPDDELGLAQRLSDARPVVEAAVERFRAFLEEEVKPRASGEGRLGPDLFQRKLRHTPGSDLPHAELLARAQRDYTAVRGEMIRLAGELWPTWIGEDPVPTAESAGSAEAAESELVRRVLDAIAEEHRQPEELLEHCQQEVDRIEAFCRERELIGLTDEPLGITWTPTFLRPYGGAFLSPPGPLDRGLKSFFWITPPGEDWPPERTESYLREDNDRMLRLLCIHEGIPGHYLQLAWSNRSASLTRAVFASGMFAEGWAVYVTQVMMDAGYGGDDPALMLIHWKFYLRAVTNAIIDVLIHTAEMTEQEAMDLMVGGGFQEEQEARAKWLRARLTSTQLSTYYLGSLEMWELEEEARRRAATTAGASGSDVAAQRIVGGLGETPGFDHRAHLEAVISHGTPPIRMVREILLGA